MPYTCGKVHPEVPPGSTVTVWKMHRLQHAVTPTVKSCYIKRTHARIRTGKIPGIFYQESCSEGACWMYMPLAAMTYVRYGMLTT